MSPEVYSEAKTVISAAVSTIASGDSPATIAVEWPNSDFSTPAPPLSWISIDIGGDASETIELGGRTWQERGAVWIHVMVPINSGIEDALVWRKAFSVAFRAAVPTTPGLYWREHAFDPLGPDDGVWRRLSLIVHYVFDDRLV